MRARAIPAIVLTFVFATLASSAYAEFKWEHFGADPYATSRDEAMRTREDAFRKLGLPAPVIAQFMHATETPGEKMRIIVGDNLSAMISKGGIVHRDVVVAFDKPPVSGKVEYAAPTEMWRVSWEGEIFTLFLPEVCNNWSYHESAPVAQVKVTAGCVEIHFITKPGDTAVKFFVLGPDDRVRKDSCTALKRPGRTTFEPWSDEVCPQSASIICDFSKHEEVVGQRVRLVGSLYLKVPGEYILRLPAFIAAKESGFVTALILVRGSVAHPAYPAELPGTKTAFAAAYRYGEQRAEWIENNSDAIGVRWFDYTNGSARVYYTHAEVPKDSAQLYWPWSEWRDDP